MSTPTAAIPSGTSRPGGELALRDRRPPASATDSGWLARLAHRIKRYRWIVIGAWIALTLLGGVAAGQLSSRWFQSTSVPGRPAYETGQQVLKVFGAGVRPPNVVVFHSGGDVTKVPAVRAAMARVTKGNPGALTSSFFSTGSLAYVSRDRHTTFEEVYLPGRAGVDRKSGAAQMRAVAAVGLPVGVAVEVTGRDALDEANTQGGDGGSSVLLEALIGGLGALLVLLFVFGTLPAVLMPLVVAVAAILNTFTLVWALTYITDVSIIVQFLIALVGLGVAIDYALLMIFRFRDELREGKDVESALVQTMTHAGRSVILSGTTVALGLLALLVVPLPLLRSMSLGGMLIPVVSVLAATTLLPALLAVTGTRINSVRVMPRRFLDRGHPEDGAWGRWARFVIRRPVAIGAAFGIVVFIFQQGHRSSLWNVAASQSITAYIPVMIFAFLFGLSMDYEVFMLTRMREAYDETGSTNRAIELGLARTGKLVTSAALVLMFAFLVLSTSPGFEIKSLAIGLAAGIIFDATVIRALLVPALMRLLGDANWWLPGWMATVLRIRQIEPNPALMADAHDATSGTRAIVRVRRN